MKNPFIDYIKRSFSLLNIISRLVQFGIAILGSTAIYVIAKGNGLTEVLQGFYSGAMFVFLLDQLDRVFIK